MSRISLRAVPFDDPDARTLLSELYLDQLTRYARADPPDDDSGDYAPPQGLFLLLYVDDQPAGCGGYRVHDTTRGEIKRFYVRPEHRGRGYGRRILTALEDHGRAVGATCLLLETGVRNEAAIYLFGSAGYSPVPGYVPRRDQRINRAFAKSISLPQWL
ncbi:MAG: GNAT family N-acetyltransferase [Pseudonocardiaceae bacterium]